MLLLIEEQSSIYVFSWTSKAKMFDRWNKTSENMIKTLKINVDDSNMAAITDGSKELNL